jgi:hypothetical protein
MPFRDRIKELRRVPARSLRPNPRNWRRHPPPQREALRAVLGEVGYADALLARELPDGTLELIDGHLRAQTTPNQDVPVLVLDISAAEADKLLAVLDPLAALAEPDHDCLAELVASIATADEAIRRIWRDVLPPADLSKSLKAATQPAAAVPVPESYQLLVDCRDEADQRALFEQLGRQGYRCRVLTL